MIHIVVVDSQEDYRGYLCEYLSNQDDFKIIGSGKDSYEAVKLVETYKPDIVLLEIPLPLDDGIKTADLIKYRSPHTSVIIHWDGKERRIFSVLFNGVSGCITKQINRELLCHSIRTVYHGGSLVAPDVADKFRTITASLTGNILISRGELRTTQFNRKRRDTVQNDSGGIAELSRNISPAEKQIIGFVGQGCTNREIAEKLYLSEGTIRNYVSAVLQKMGFRDRTQVAIYAVKAGL
jgi:DNA-binding NarL/FixJ family response regulator